MRRKNLKISARYEEPIAALLGEAPAQRSSEKRITAAFPIRYCGSLATSREKFAERLAQLESENLDLRHRAVELALQIQSLGMKVAR